MRKQAQMRTWDLQSSSLFLVHLEGSAICEECSKIPTVLSQWKSPILLSSAGQMVKIRECQLIDPDSSYVGIKAWASQHILPLHYFMQWSIWLCTVWIYQHYMELLPRHLKKLVLRFGPQFICRNKLRRCNNFQKKNWIWVWLWSVLGLTWFTDFA